MGRGKRPDPWEKLDLSDFCVKRYPAGRHFLLTLSAGRNQASIPLPGKPMGPPSGGSGMAPDDTPEAP